MGRRLLPALLLLLMPAAVSAQEAACRDPLVTVRPDGTAESGSKEALRAAVMAGQPVRVGWALDWDGNGSTDIVHWADAAFLSVFEGEVFTQVVQIHRQVPQPGKADVRLYPGASYFNSSIGTTGIWEGRFQSDEPRSFRVRSWWCLDPRAAEGGRKR